MYSCYFLVRFHLRSEDHSMNTDTTLAQRAVDIFGQEAKALERDAFEHGAQRSKAMLLGEAIALREAGDFDHQRNRDEASRNRGATWVATYFVFPDGSKAYSGSDGLCLCRGE